jgi:GMP synthase (glutamine-hydrolysing)
MQVLVLKMGTTEPSVAAEHGDYDHWFRVVLEAAGCTVSVLNAFEGAVLPDSTSTELCAVDGILLTGSPLSVRDRAPWMRKVGEWTLDQARRGTPVFAICFGHQLVGECLGAPVTENERGPEWGAVAVTIHEKDPLFEGLPESIVVQASHRDILQSVPDGAICLAGNANTSVQAYAWGEHLRAVQFHPEAPAQAIADLLAARGLVGRFEHSEHGRKILNNWVQHWLV